MSTLDAGIADLLAFLEARPTASAANLSDVLQGLHTMDPGIVPVASTSRVVGRAFTVRAYPGSIITVHKALTEARRGDVLVVDGEGDVRAGALIGEIMARECMRKGFAAVVVDGAVRDVDGIAELGLPVYARGMTPRVGTNRRLGRTGVEISCGGLLVRPGDVVVADRDGVVVVPASEAGTVRTGLAALLEKEAALCADIDAGHEIADLLEFRPLFR